jgi:hypothetical protein
MRKIIAVLIAALFFIAGTNIAFAKGGGGKGEGGKQNMGGNKNMETKENRHRHEMRERNREKGDEEALESQAGTMPPGLEKQDKTPKGLEKKGKTPKGWGKGKKEGWKK